ncbi:transaldolase [archaeon]|nr:transaldolase [archaeon]
MKLFVDTAELEEIQALYAIGIVDGVTTNPSLIKKAVDRRKKHGDSTKIETYIKKILKTAKGTPVSLEVTKTEYAGMVDEGVRLYKKFNPVARNVYVKIPVNPAMKKNDVTCFDGIRAIKTLAKKNIPVNCTLIFTPEQALLAAKAGAAFVSPFLGRENDFIRKKGRWFFKKEDYYPSRGRSKDGKLVTDQGVSSGANLVNQCVTILKKYNLKTQVLAASIRSTQDVLDVALAGSDIATIPYNLFKELLTHQKTIEGMKTFTKDIVPEYAKLLGVTK